MNYQYISTLQHDEAKEETISIICSSISENNIEDIEKLKKDLGNNFVNYCINVIKGRINDL